MTASEAYQALEDDWDRTKRGQFERSPDLACPACGTLYEDTPEAPTTGTAYATLTCIDRDCEAEYDVIPLTDASWAIRVRRARLWQDFSDEAEWDESGGLSGSK